MSSDPFAVRILLLVTQLVSFLLPVAAFGQADESETLGLPFRAIDLPPGHFWTVTNDHGPDNARDLGVLRKTNAGGFSGKTANGEMNTACRESGIVDCDVYGGNLTYGLPLVAPVDGVVVSCWRNHENAPTPRRPHPRRCCGGLLKSDGKCLLGACDRNCQEKLDDCDECPANTPNECRITRSGNHVALLTNDMRTVIVSHLAPGTIPARLCPFDEPLMQDARNKPCRRCPFPTESTIPEGQRPVVKRGDFLGRVGRSGASGGPHVHTGTRRVAVNGAGHLRNDDQIPYRAVSAWMRARDDENGWQKMDGAILPREDGNELLHPTPFLRRSSLAGSAIQQITLTSSAVTATKTASNKLQVTSWGVTAGGKISIQTKKATSGDVTRFAVARPGNGRSVITALEAANGTLKLIFWRVTSSGQVTRGASSSTAGAVDDVALTRYPVGRGVVSAVKTASGDLKVTAWDVTDDDDIVRRGSASGTPVRAVAVATIKDGRTHQESSAQRFEGVVTAAKTAAGRLRVTTWRFDRQNASLSRVDSANAGEITGHLAVVAVAVEPAREMIVTAARSTDGMRVISWQVDSQGTLTKRRERRLGEAREITPRQSLARPFPHCDGRRRRQAARDRLVVGHDGQDHPPRTGAGWRR